MPRGSGLREDVMMGVFFKYQNTISALPSSTQVQLDLAEIDLSQGAAQW